jgi:hypothetical protein
MRRAALLVALLSCGDTVSAAPKSNAGVEAEVERLEMARDHFQKGEGLEKAGSLEAALLEYELAEVAHPSPVVAEAKKRVRATIEERRQAAQPAVDMSRAPRQPEELRLRRFIAPIVLAPLALGTLVAGAALTGVVASDYNHLKSSCSPTCNPRDVDALKPRESAGYALLGVGAALAVTDIVLWGVLARKRSPSVRASVSLDAQGGSASVRGSF